MLQPLWALPFLLLLLCATATDIRTRRIPNALSGTTLLLGVVHTLATLPAFTSASVGSSLLHITGGVALGLVLWLPWYSLSFLGAGDVKFMAALGAWFGPMGILAATLYTALWGAVVSIGHLLWTQGWVLTLTRLTTFKFPSLQTSSTPSSPDSSPDSIEEMPEGVTPAHPTAQNDHNATAVLPYAVAICLGALTAAYTRQLFF